MWGLRFIIWCVLSVVFMFMTYGLACLYSRLFGKPNPLGEEKPGEGLFEEFLEKQVYPALFERLDEAFPEFGWTRTSEGWTATNAEHVRKLRGVSSAHDVVECKELFGLGPPQGYAINGIPSMAWIAYANGGEAPEGLAFVETTRHLAKLANVVFPEAAWTPEQQQTYEEKGRAASRLTFFMILAIILALIVTALIPLE